MLDWKNENKMTSRVPCYPLTSAGIFKSSSWPPSVVAELKRHTGKNVELLQIPPAASDFAVSAPLIYGAQVPGETSGTKQWQISY